MSGRIDFIYHILNTYKFKGSIIINLLDIQKTKLSTLADITSYYISRCDYVT